MSFFWRTRLFKIVNGSLIINNSDGKANYSQRNNEFVHKNPKGEIDVSAATMCNVTALCQAADYNGWRFPAGKYSQPEDNLADFMFSDPRVDEYYAKAMPALYRAWKAGEKDSYPPNELHEVLAKGFNLWIGSDADRFAENAKIWDIITEILEGRSCVVSGVFRLPNGKKLNHIVTLVGAIWHFKSVSGVSAAVKAVSEQKILPAAVIIDDTYGNFRENYKPGVTGNDIQLSWQEFVDMMKPAENPAVKYCHFISSGAAAV